MATAKRLVLLAILAFAGGCQPKPAGVRELADGRLVPAYWSDFVKPVVQDRATHRLHYDSLYVFGPEKLNVAPHPGWAERWETTWYRFWDGGQVLEKPRFERKPDHTPLTAADGDNFRGPGPGVGRYSVVGDRLRMEFIGFAENGWTWVRQSGRVNEDGSFTIYPRRPLGYYGPLEPPRTYRRHVVGEMRRFPDW
jgi:hypothetical protein